MNTYMCSCRCAKRIIARGGAHCVRRTPPHPIYMCYRGGVRRHVTRMRVTPNTYMCWVRVSAPCIICIPRVRSTCYGCAPVPSSTPLTTLLHTPDATDHAMLVVLMGSAVLGIVILVFSDSLHVSVHAELVIISIVMSVLEPGPQTVLVAVRAASASAQQGGGTRTAQ